jgi:hypothetical protein
MAIGLERKEINSLFEKEYGDSLKKRSKVPKGSMEGIYELQGFSTLQAKALTELTLKMMANKEAVLEIIYQNNLRIESQLKHKGIEL